MEANFEKSGRSSDDDAEKGAAFAFPSFCSGGALVNQGKDMPGPVWNDRQVLC